MEEEAAEQEVTELDIFHLKQVHWNGLPTIKTNIGACLFIISFLTQISQISLFVSQLPALSHVLKLSSNQLAAILISGPTDIISISGSHFYQQQANNPGWINVKEKTCLDSFIACVEFH